MSIRTNDLEGLKWFSTGAQIVGAAGLAANMPDYVTPFICYLAMTAGSLGWLGIALTADELALAALNSAFLAINLIGIWRWFA